MTIKEKIQEIIQYHRKKGGKDRPQKRGMFDYHHRERTTESIPCDPKCAKLLKELEYQKLKETVKG